MVVSTSRYILYTLIVVCLALVLSACSLTAADAVGAQAAGEQYAKGNALVQQGKFTEALVEYQKVLADFKDQPEVCAKAQLQIGKAYRGQGDNTKAYYALRKVTNGYAQFPHIAVWAQVTIADMYQSKAAYEEILTKYPDQTDKCIAALFGLAKAYQSRMQLDRALDTLKRIIDNYPDNYRAVSDAMLTRAKLYQQMEDTDGAKAEMERLIQRYPTCRHICASAKLKVAESLVSTDRAAAKKIADDLAKDEVVRGSSDLLYALLGFQFLSLQDDSWRETAEAYVRTVSESGDRARAEFAPIEVAHYFERDAAKAKKLSSEFLKKYARHDLAAEAAYIQGSCLVSCDEKESALAILEAIAFGNSRYSDCAAQQCAGILLDLGRFEEAVAHLERLKPETPADAASILDRIGVVWVSAGRYEQAIEAFAREANLKWLSKSVLARCYYHLGISYAGVGDRSVAMSYIQKAISCAPDSPWGAKARGTILLWNRIECNNTGK